MQKGIEPELLSNIKPAVQKLHTTKRKYKSVKIQRIVNRYKSNGVRDY